MSIMLVYRRLLNIQIVIRRYAELNKDGTFKTLKESEFTLTGRFSWGAQTQRKVQVWANSEDLPKQAATAILLFGLHSCL